MFNYMCAKSTKRIVNGNVCDVTVLELRTGADVKLKSKMCFHEIECCIEICENCK